MFLQQPRKLRSRGRFAGAIQPDNQNSTRFAEIERRGVAAEQDRQFVIKNLNDLLTGRDATQHGFAKCFFLDPGNEFFCDLKIDISLEQRQPHLAERGVDVHLADRPVAAKILKDLLQLVTQLRKHLVLGFWRAHAPSRAGDRASAIANFSEEIVLAGRQN